MKIRCYLYRKASTQQWIAATNDLSILPICYGEPEDALRRMQVLVLKEISEQVDSDTKNVTDNLEITITFEIISEDEAGRILNQGDPWGDMLDDLDP